ncbi:hypothetical protein CHH28_06605 [Bacterioplanes sanyensis]|uniref:Metallo-beta-lactamase domain-containing protein n=1 Tax=Bacterioplanes sanyensis TaxID=1249553 RepID=A0A222FHY2_9GAMM|nr:hypothetical protein CHH28_06605 [Bacterioplanes sanyensis]
MPLQTHILPVTPFAQNCTILVCSETQQAAVVDPGGEVDRIIAKLQQLEVNAVKILLTHAHIDHAGGTHELAQRLQLPIIGPHQGDRFWIDGLPQQSAMFGFPAVEVFEPDQWLQHGDEIQLGNVQLQVLHTPGHTPGHVVFYSADDKLALVGDVLFNGSIGRTDFPQGNHGELIASIRERLFPLGDDITFICGHGPNSTFGHERQHNPFVSDHRG